MVDERAAIELMEDLRFAGPHSRTQAGGHYKNIDFRAHAKILTGRTRLEGSALAMRRPFFRRAGVHRA
jgi:hypothetical protein